MSRQVFKHRTNELIIVSPTTAAATRNN